MMWGGINCLLWPARSPDLSPIEHLWDNLGRRIHDPELYPMPPATLEELSARLRREWARTYRSDFLGEEYMSLILANLTRQFLVQF